MTCYLGIDYGTRRIGIAVGDDDIGVAYPLSMVPATGHVSQDAEAVQAAATEYDVDAYVVGLPLNMDGTEGRQAKLTRRFGKQLARQSGRDVHYTDERLSSATADELLAPAELTHKKHKARRDAVAAQVILQTYLDRTK